MSTPTVTYCPGVWVVQPRLGRIRIVAAVAETLVIISILPESSRAQSGLIADTKESKSTGVVKRSSREVISVIMTVKTVIVKVAASIHCQDSWDCEIMNS